MKKHRLFLLRFLLALLCIGLRPAPASVPAAQSNPTAPDIQALDSFIAGELKAKGLVGLSVALMIDGKIVLAKGYGLSALDGSPATPET